MSTVRSRNPIPTTSIPRRPRPRRFQGGDLVEVASFAEGFYGSYYEATVVSDLGQNGYLVQYRTLVKDDFSGPLREVVSAAEVQPRPPVVVAAEYFVDDVVDVFDNDGWWMGKITARSDDGDDYLVYFPTTGDEMQYTKDRLRLHQDWKNGRWNM